MVQFSDQSGSYAVVLKLNSHRKITIGKLGYFDFQTGVYLYTGSAFGPGGVSARLRRHQEFVKKMHWHIDYLRAECDLLGMLALLQPECSLEKYSQESMRMECLWIQELVRIHGATFPVEGFGSSDCRSGCQAHLLYVSNIEIEEIRTTLQNISPGIIKVGV